MTMLRETAIKINPESDKGKYVEAVLRHSKRRIGEPRVAEMWNESQLDWSEFLPVKEIVDFVSKHVSRYFLFLLFCWQLRAP